MQFHRIIFLVLFFPASAWKKHKYGLLQHISTKECATSVSKKKKKKTHCIGLTSSFSSICWSLSLIESHWKGYSGAVAVDIWVCVLNSHTLLWLGWWFVSLCLFFPFVQHASSGQHWDFTRLVAVTSHLLGLKFLLRKTERERESDLTERIIFWELMPINSRLLRWSLFVTDRVQCVMVNSALSNPVAANTGAPRGSTVSTVLFTL